MTRPSHRPPYRPRPSFALVALAALVITACSDSSGCSALAPIPSGRYEGPKTDNAVTVRLSPHGINYLNQNWRDVLEQFAPGAQMSFPMGCMIQNVPALGDIVIADQGNCGTEACGRMDGKCDSKDLPKNIPITITGFQLTPRPPDTIEATLTIEVNTGEIYASTVNRKPGVCGGFACVISDCPLKCGLTFNTAAETPNFNRLRAEVAFSIDQRWDKLLSFSVTELGGSRVCGSSGASGKPECFDPSDIDIDGHSNCGTVYCGVADWDFVKEFILEQISPMLQEQISGAIDGQTCMACGSGLPACPTNAEGVVSTCTDGVCVDPGTSKCVPRFLGIEGRMSPGLMLSGFGLPTDAQLDMSVAAGSSVVVDEGLLIGTRAGVTAVQTAACVPMKPAPQLQPMSVPNFDAEAPTDAQYHVGVGVATSFLDLGMHHAHQSGTLCINLSSANFGILNTGLFKTFLPSLGRLATRDGKDAPMMVVLRPANVPVLQVGEGTFDPVTKKPIKPLLTLGMTDLTIDFYAMIDDRFARLFSLTADVQIPLSLIFENCSSVTPALGDLNQLITNVRTANSEMLAEDPNVLAELIPAVIGLAEPALAGALQPFELPDVGGFKMKVNATKGLTHIAGTERYEHLGIYAELMGATAQCVTGAPQAMAVLVESRVPSEEQMRLRGERLQWPTAVLKVDALGAVGTPEYAYRVDGGLWSTFLAPAAGGTLEVSHPRLLLQGRHTIEVRTRLAENPHGISAPVSVGFVVDYEAPEVTLRPDREAGVVHVSARDFVSAKETLAYAYRVGDGEPSSFGPARVIDLHAVEAQGGVEVLVKDESGHIGRATWRVPKVDLRGDEVAQAAEAFAQDSGTGGGCSSAGGGLGLWAIGAAAAALFRRRRREAKA